MRRPLSQIIVRTLSGRKVILSVNEDDTVETFQFALAASYGVPVESQEIRVGNDKLSPGRRLCDYNLRENSEVLLVRKLPPRPPGKAPRLRPELRSVVDASNSLPALFAPVFSPMRTKPLLLGKSRIRRENLKCVGRLGVGAFGVVTLEEDTRTHQTYALKAVSKGYLVQLKMIHSVQNERRILQMVDSPFVVRLICTYNGPEHVFFLLEAALGGELFTTYERHRLYGSETHARFYVGCVVEAFEHLHQHHVIYRDLKPENLLLDMRGYCKITDMGLAKITQNLTHTLVGTPDYMAPEVIDGTGHTEAVDWWMLGILLFELLAGRPPFEAETTELLYDEVRRGIGHVVFPPECQAASDLVRSLCRHCPEDRLCTPHLRKAQWFQPLDWQRLRALQLTPPRVPSVESSKDFSNFRSCDDEDPPLVAYQETGCGWDLEFEEVESPESVPKTCRLTQRKQFAAEGERVTSQPLCAPDLKVYGRPCGNSPAPAGG